MTDFVNKVCPECGSSSFWATGSIKWDICLQKVNTIMSLLIPAANIIITSGGVGYIPPLIGG